MLDKMGARIDKFGDRTGAVTILRSMTTRMALVAALCAALLGAGAGAQSGAPLKLPLDNLGLEHLDIVVPDTAAAAQFYARIFRTELHQQPVRDTLRVSQSCSVTSPRIARSGTSRLAQPRAGRRRSGITACSPGRTRVTRSPAPWRPQACRQSPRPPAPSACGRIRMVSKLQLFQPPAGLVTAAVKSPLPVEGEGLLTPRGVNHVMLSVSSFDKALPYPAPRALRECCRDSARRQRSHLVPPRARDPSRAAAGDGWQRRRSAISRSRSRHSIGRPWRPGFASCTPRCCRRRTNRTSCGSGTTTGSRWKCGWRNDGRVADHESEESPDAEGHDMRAVRADVRDRGAEPSRRSRSRCTPAAARRATTSTRQ